MKIIGLGCMRLDNAEVIRAALDAGATLLDTADAYGTESLVAQALAEWSGDRSKITVATKGGMRRPKGAWVPDGRGKHLAAACEASRVALGVETIDLYQLHVVDPATPLETSVRALARLQADGKIRDVGLCNVNVSQIRAAQAIVPIVSVQVSLSPLDDDNLRNGVAEYCRDNGIRLIAYRPLGGLKGVKKQILRLAALAQNDKEGVIPSEVEESAPHAFTSEEVALAWLMDLGTIPIPGATRVETARSIGRALSVELTERARQQLDAEFSGRLLRVPRAKRKPSVATGEVVVVMGMPGSGKTTIAREMEADGYARLNRDERGGSLTSLVPRLDELLKAGEKRVVLDNTYPSRKSRNEIIETAWGRGASVRCIWLTTSVADAQINSIHRMIEAHGSLPMPEDIKANGKNDPRYLGPDAQFRYERTLEPSTLDEGFESVEERAFVRASDGGEPALIVDFNDLTDAARRNRLSEHPQVLVHAWMPTIDLEEMRRMLGERVDIAICPHQAGPPICWCRKPIPGSVIEFALKRGVSLSKSIVRGSSAADKTMAERIGARFESW